MVGCLEFESSKVCGWLLGRRAAGVAELVAAEKDMHTWTPLPVEVRSTADAGARQASHAAKAKAARAVMTRRKRSRSSAKHSSDSSCCVLVTRGVAGSLAACPVCGPPCILLERIGVSVLCSICS